MQCTFWFVIYRRYRSNQKCEILLKVRCEINSEKITFSNINLINTCTNNSEKLKGSNQVVFFLTLLFSTHFLRPKNLSQDPYFNKEQSKLWCKVLPMSIEARWHGWSNWKMASKVPDLSLGSLSHFFSPPESRRLNTLWIVSWK